MKTFSAAILIAAFCASAVFADSTEDVQPGNYLTQFLTDQPFASYNVPNITLFLETIECTIKTINEQLVNTQYSEVFQKFEGGLAGAAEKIVKCPSMEEEKIAQCAWEQVDVASDNISKFVLDMVYSDAQVTLTTLQTLKATCGRQH